MELQYIIFGCMIGTVVGYLFAKLIFLRQKSAIQRDAVRGSRNSITGELYEKILPALPHFPYAPKDMVFIGKGSDYIIFDGLSSGQLREIIFLELKSGQASLNTNERMIKNTIEKKHVRYSEYRIDAKKND